MQNQVFDALVAGLTVHFGTGHPLDSGTGVRFQLSKRGKLTAYHTNIATGNQAEIAFEPGTVAKRLAMTERELRSLIGELRTKTGRGVSPDPQFNWPRVGLADTRDVELVLAAIENGLQSV